MAATRSLRLAAPPARARRAPWPADCCCPQASSRISSSPRKRCLAARRRTITPTGPAPAKKGVPTALPVEFACQLTEVALLGTLALRTEKVLEWDSASMRVTNQPEANRFVEPPYRAGWKL